LLRKVVAGLTILLGLYFVVRAVVEPFVIDINDPASYRDDWGGPSLLGVLAVHCGPGLLALVAFCLVLLRRRRVTGTGARV
jgi:predicted transporter